MIRTADTDVVVLAVAAVVTLNLEELWVSYDRKKPQGLTRTSLCSGSWFILINVPPFVPRLNAVRHNILLRWTREENSLDNMGELSRCYVCVSGTGTRPVCYFQ